MTKKNLFKYFVVAAGAILLLLNSKHYYAELCYTLLQDAAWDNNTKKAIFLLKIGASPSPYEEIIEINPYIATTPAPLHLAVEKNNLKLAKSLIKAGALVDWCCCSCWTALHSAVKIKNIDMVRLLLNHGAAIKPKHSNEDSALEMAEKISASEIVALLRAHKIL